MSNQVRRELRSAFERWITKPPDARSVERFGPDDSAWPGQYRDLGVQIAWELWQEDSRHQRDRDA